MAQVKKSNLRKREAKKVTPQTKALYQAGTEKSSEGIRICFNFWGKPVVLSEKNKAAVKSRPFFGYERG